MPEHTLTDDDDDAAITEAIASEVVARVERSHPHASPAFWRLLVRLYTLQACGKLPPPGIISDQQLADHLGMDFRRLSETRLTALTKAYLHIRKHHPEL
jgi:hypothetical protein